MNRLFIFLFIIGLAVKSDAVVFLPLDDSEHRFFYKQIERNEYQHHTVSDYFKAPQFIPDSLTDFTLYKFLQIESIENANLILSFNDRLFIKEKSKTISFEKLKAKLFVKPFSNVYFYSSISLDEQKAEDSVYTGKKWRGLAGGIEQSFATYNSKTFTAIAGRFKAYWGIEKSLLLSAEQPLDGFSYSLKWKKLTLSYQLAKLNQIGITLGTLFYENRYFAGHRIDVALNDNFRFGLFESVIFGGYGRTIEFNYLNPVLFFHSDQLNDNTNDNTFLGFDFTYFHKKTKLYGQVFVDDMQIEKKSQGDEEPDQIGLTIGVFQTDICNNTDLEFTYTRITNRTYNQAYPKNRYTENNRSLGYYDTNDFDLISAEVRHWLSRKTILTLNASYHRQGEGSINDAWTEPWLDIEGDYSEDFPTGIVEKRTKLQLGVESFVSGNFFIKADGGYLSTANSFHIESNSEKTFFLNLYLTAYLFSTL